MGVLKHTHAYLENVTLESTEILEISFSFLYLHAIKRMLLESLSITLTFQNKDRTWKEEITQSMSKDHYFKSIFF